MMVRASLAVTTPFHPSSVGVKLAIVPVLNALKHITRTMPRPFVETFKTLFRDGKRLLFSTHAY